MTGLNYVITSGIGRTVAHPSLDQIKPSAGYTKRNTRVVAWWFNVAKQTYTDKEVISLCKRVAKQHS